MLASLQIKHFAIIDELHIEFGPGLNVLTGETGAGKTIILQALNLVLGSRAASDVIRTGEESACVTASFSLGREGDDLRRVLAEWGMEAEGDVIIHRVISQSGKNKITINGIPATVQMLRDLSSRLVDISSQHEHQLLMDPAQHASIVDRFGRLEELLNRYRETHARYRSLREEVDRLQHQEADASERLDFLKFQYDELRQA